MGFTNFPNGLTSMGVPLFGGIPQLAVGNVFHLVTAKGSTDPYYVLLKDRVEDGNIFASLTDAHAAMTSNQGDVLIVYPGSHVQADSLTWSKSNTMIVGAGSPNQTYQPSTLTTGGVRLTCTTAAVGQILNITGHYVSMYNIGTQNSASDSGNISDIRIVGRNFYARNCAFRGGTGATQIGTADCGLGVFVDTSVAGAGNGMVLEQCTIGSSGNTIRTVGACCMSFGAGSAAGGFEPRFYDCVFSAYTQTSGCYFINAQYNAGFDRFALFKNCLFLNFANPATPMAEAIRNNNDTAWIVLQNCGGFGFTKWSSTGVNHTYVCMTAVNGSGGISTISA
jgi:hypothetical protein